MITRTLLTLLVLSYGFAFLHIKMERHAIKRAVKFRILEGIDNEELVHFSFSKREAAALEWEHDDEFEYNGMMYDVVRRIDGTSTLELWCWVDGLESASNRKMDNLIANILGDLDDEDDGINRLLSNLFFTSADSPNYSADRVDPKVTAKGNKNFINFNASPPVPPPESI